jgi:hypothetical protein
MDGLETTITRGFALQPSHFPSRTPRRGLLPSTLWMLNFPSSLLWCVAFNVREYPLYPGLFLSLIVVWFWTDSLAMLAGLITPPIILSSALSLDGQLQSYLISACLIGCGILSSVQISRIKLWGRFRLGTGLISVVGTSFATLSTAFSVRRFNRDSRVLKKSPSFR